MHALNPELVKPLSFDPEAGINVGDDVALANVRHNIRLGLPQAKAYAVQPSTALLVCGGPSLELPEVQAALLHEHWSGGVIVAVNGSYNWCLEHNLKPSMACMMDAREFSARFFARVAPGCRYLIASQAHPRAFEVVAGRDVTIWHTLTGGDEEMKVLDEFYFGHHHPVTLGTTIGVRALSLLRMLGFVRFHIFGMDSCWLDHSHHGYVQRENDDDYRVPVWLRPQGRDDLAQRFVCAPWHIRQYQDVQRLIQDRGNLIKLCVHGPGLIAYMLRTGARIQTDDEDDTS